MKGTIGTIYLIARREFVTRVRTRVFIIGTALILVGLTGYIAFQLFVVNKSAKGQTYKVAFIGEAASLADPFIGAEKALGVTIDRQPVSSQSQGTSLVRRGKLDALISGSVTSPEVTVRSAVPTALVVVLQGIVRQDAFNAELAAAGLNPATVNANLARATVRVESLSASSGNRIELVAAGFVVAVLLYIALLTYGTFIAQGVVEEKANRIVEILLSTVRPEQLLIGKVVGIGLVGLLQLTIIGVAAIVLTTATHLFTVPAIAVSAVLAGILWFVLGFFLYAVLFAAAGSLVSRSEEVQSASIPITMIAILSYFVAIGVLTPMFDGSPMSSTGIILAMIPPISPVIMPTGMTTGDIGPGLAVLAVVLTLITSAAATWLAARIYANSVLRLGARVRLSEALAGSRRRV